MIRKLKPSFDDYELEPSPEVWMKIESKLDAAPEDRKGWLYFSFAAVGMIVIVLFFTLFYDVEILLKPKRHDSKETVQADGNQKLRENANHSFAPTASIVKDESFSANGTTEGNKGGRQDVKSIHGDAMKNLPVPGKRKSNSVLDSFHLSANKNIDQRPVKNFPEDEVIVNEARYVADKMEPIDPFSLLAEPELKTVSSVGKQVSVLSDGYPISRLMVSIGSMYEYNYRVINFQNGSASMSENERAYFNNEKGIHSFSFSAMAGYSFSTHLSLVSGVNYFSAGQERSQSVVTQKTVNISNPESNLYAVSTSAGNVTGSSQQLDHLYYSNMDSTLIVPVATLAPNGTSAIPNSVVADFKFRQQFYFISIPVLLQYQATEHLFTPYVAMGFSAGYMVYEKTLFNGNALDYHYSGNLTKFLFSAETQVGIKCKISNHYSCSVQSALRYGLDAINKQNPVKWIPYSYGIGAALNYRF